MKDLNSAKNDQGPTQEHDAVSVLQIARKNIRAALLIAKNTEKAKNVLLEMSNDPVCCRKMKLICCVGWQQCKEQQKALMLNCGVVAALFLSVMISLAVSRLEPNAADDSWADSRDSLADAIIVLNILSVLFSMGVVLMSVLGMVLYDLYVIDLDDQEFVGGYFVGGLTCMYLLVMSCAFAVLALACAMLVLLPDPLATIVFSVTLLGMAILLINGWRIYRACDLKACKEYADNCRADYNQLVEDVCKDIQAGQENEVVAINSHGGVVSMPASTGRTE